ncbi:SusD/RagB family nutrient-binding outer membrane lipoprotein [Flavobacterium sp. XN-5]|uniref:SusD/RagB family nutrient-binding outer membrane lipoprotein n=1 Tax=Flavobacterium sp. XN-5 TaxID=2599390 RepID=UPI0011C7AF8A|nr:SusD/RagB family nutrient-binding outer membrane lipoprotein [Flavobacterium sp. XN-5]NGY37196.1 SusD/RagB family nutrient-binding outer membrane lipoprotein [Flavobacterium sp. XN-5]
MKNITKYIAVSMVALLSTACNRDEIADVNINPSFPTVTEPIYLLPNIQASMAVGLQFDSRFLGKYTQYFSHTSANYIFDQYGYIANSDSGGEIWKMAYYSIGLNLTQAQEVANKNQRYDIVGLSKAIRAWTWQVSTDYHSNLIKFDQAFTSRLTFDYGTQEEAYTEVVRLAKEAIVDLERTDGKSDASYTAKGDLIYGGDKAKWTKFAYGVLARNSNNLINKATYSPDKVIEYVNKSLSSINDDCYVKFTATSTSDANFYGPSRNNLNSFRQSDFILRAMDGTVFGGTVDPRMPNVLQPSADGVFRGNPLSTTAGTVAATRIPNLWGTTGSGNSTIPGRYLFRDKADFPLMTYAELQFIKAEAAFIKGDKIMALDAYKKGIEASIDMVNRNTVVSTVAPTAALITASQKATFLSDVNIVPTAANLTIKHIMMQKYVALFGYGYLETWTDMRKYHYDPLVYETIAFPTLAPDNNGKLAYRVRPRFNSEYVWNFAALEAIGADKPSYHTEEMWFSQP